MCYISVSVSFGGFNIFILLFSGSHGGWEVRHHEHPNMFCPIFLENYKKAKYKTVAEAAAL